MTELLTSPAHGQLARWLDEEVPDDRDARTERASAPRRTDRRRARPLATPRPPRPARALHGAAPPAGAARRLAPLLARGAGDRAPRPRSLGGRALRLRRNARRGRAAVQLVELARHRAPAPARRNEPGLRRRPHSRRAVISARIRRPRSTSTRRRSAGWATTSSAPAACGGCSAATTTERWSRDGHGEPGAARARRRTPGRSSGSGSRRRGSSFASSTTSLIPELARVARDGVHDPGHMPFGNGWTDRPEEDWYTGFARYFWLQRGAWDVRRLGAPVRRPQPTVPRSVCSS